MPADPRHITEIEPQQIEQMRAGICDARGVVTRPLLHAAHAAITHKLRQTLMHGIESPLVSDYQRHTVPLAQTDHFIRAAQAFRNWLFA
ncbi:MAG: hypothetical protein WA876_11760, partial [Candidatus Acidiferrales bacterium]